MKEMSKMSTDPTDSQEEEMAEDMMQCMLKCTPDNFACKKDFMAASTALDDFEMEFEMFNGGTIDDESYKTGLSTTCADCIDSCYEQTGMAAMATEMEENDDSMDESKLS